MTHFTDTRSGTSTNLPRIGGALGMAGSFIGTGIFLLGCFGFGAAFALSPIPLILGAVGLVLTLCGMFFKHIAGEDTHVVASLLVNIAVIVGAIMEICLWRNIPFFAGQGGM
jgi:hypothetical protein